MTLYNDTSWLDTSFRQLGRVWRLHVTCLKFNFFDAVMKGRVNEVQEVLGMFPEAVRWEEGRSYRYVIAGAAPIQRAVIGKEAGENSAAIIRLLVENGANVNWQDADDRTALWYAAYNGNKPAIAALIAAGANSDLPDKNGSSAWEVASWQDNYDDFLYREGLCNKPSANLVLFMREKIRERKERVIASVENLAVPVKTMRVLRFRNAG